MGSLSGGAGAGPDTGGALYGNVQWDYGPVLVDLALSDEQQAPVSSFEQLLLKGASPEQVRSAEPTGFDEALRGTLTDTGAVVMAVGEEIGRASRREEGWQYV